MQTELHIAVHNMPRSDALDARIRDCVAKLELVHPRIISCRVAVEQADKHHHQGRQFTVKVEVRAPGREDVVATHHHHEDVYVAVRDAFDSVRRQLEDKVRRARGDVKVHTELQHGKVVRMDAEAGFGFIESDEGSELYFSRDNVVHPSFEALLPGTPVHFIEDESGGSPQAKRVSAAPA
ncbi:MAG TPA: HPF/RaiA family ribosome-associated protein [Usitatibacter sp.]|nr:HPF/RaiA family ribosome-associated protein [Usitatibacter sp.]